MALRCAERIEHLHGTSYVMCAPGTLGLLPVVLTLVLARSTSVHYTELAPDRFKGFWKRRNVSATINPLSSFYLRWVAVIDPRQVTHALGQIWPLLTSYHGHQPSRVLFADHPSQTFAAVFAHSR